MNKGVVVVVGAIALTGIAIGGFVAMELGGTNGVPADGTATGTPNPTDGPTSGTATGTATATASDTGTATASDTATPTATPTPRPEIDEAELEAAVLEAVNDRRAERGIDRLSTLDTLVAMARFHSDNMAAQGFLSHVAGGYTAAERYEEYGLADRCRIADDSNTGVREDEELEVIGRVTVGENGTTEEELADAAVTTWFAEEEPRRRLTYRNAERIGVGVNVTDEGRAYLTVNLC